MIQTNAFIVGGKTLYRNIRNTREGFVPSNIGDGLINIESKLLGIVLFFLGIFWFKMGFIASIVLGIIIAWIFPWLVGLVTFFAWLVMIIFSIIWAILGYFIGGALLGNSPVAGAIIAIMALVSSVFAHRVFAGIGYVSEKKYVMDRIDSSANSLEKINGRLASYQNLSNSNATEYPDDSDISHYCVKCGNRINPGDKFCGKCGSQI